MSSTNKTEHYNLPQFIGSDIPTWLGDFNSAMTAIDSGINAAATSASGAGTTAAQAQASANSAISSAASASQAASDAAAAVTAEKERAEGAETAIINSIPSTTVNMTLYAETWNDGSYTITNDLITSTSNQEIIPTVGITADQYKAMGAAMIVDGGQSAGSLTLKALGTAPTIDIPIRIIFRGEK